jgi:5-methylcytosine-specific restriction endonuclease McrA
MANQYIDNNGQRKRNISENVYIGHEAEYKRIWYIKNRIRMQKLQRARYARNKTHYLLMTKLWQQKHPELVREIKQRNKDKTRFGGNRKKILERDNHECQMCGRKDKLLIHHIDGTNNRGKRNANNNPSNLITVCKPCHTKIHFHGEDIVRTA